MELLLNSAWVLAATAAVALWLSRARTPRVRPLQGLLVIGCAFALLFPIVSMSDDLRSARVVMEDANATSKKLLKASHLSRTPLPVEAMPAAVVPALVHNPLWQTLALVPFEQQVTVASLPCPSSSGRAPPALT